MKRFLILAGIVFFFAACGKKADAPPIPPTVPVPEKSSLLFPAANSICTSGTVISDTQSTIAFSWTTAANAESYDIVIKNLITSAVTQQTTSDLQLQIALDRNAPYSWYVISKSSKTKVSARSDAAKFYSAGLGVVYYAPFPADIVSPLYGTTLTATTVNLVWKGSSTDNDIVGYDIYFGTTASPTLLKSNITDMFLNGLTINTGTQYYWRVVTKDAQGNTSSSDISQFKTN